MSMEEREHHAPAPTRRSGRITTRRVAARTGPMLLGAIDIGSTAVRMNISEHVPEQPLRVIEELSHPISTGADTFRHGHILPETIHSICGILNNFLRLLDDYGVTSRRAVASSAVREADNREILVDRIRHYSDLELVVLDAVEESRFVYQALLPWLKQQPGAYSLALNLGGGSTEIMILRGEDLQIGGVKRLGASRLFHAAGQGSNQSRGEILKNMASSIVGSVAETFREYTISRFFLINRTLYRAFRNDPDVTARDNDFSIPARQLREHLNKAYSLSPLEIGRKFNMGLADVELLVPAMMILDNFIAAANVSEVTFTNTEMMNGLLIDMAMEAGGIDPLISFRQQMVRSARAVGEKYFYDRAHARIVTDFSLRLFDALAGLLDLSRRDRLLLELAAVLHDIGDFVSDIHHHVHSAYLINWSDIVGVNEADRFIISQIAYFHRLEMPTAQNPEFMSLSKEDRIRVRKLAGILRAADVLDRGHSQQVKDLRVELSDDRMILFLQIAGDLEVIMEALPRKVDLLEQVTGLQATLRREIPRL